jgi:hypothetical protein
MPSLDPQEEAEMCRRQALAYLGRPEADLLLRLARGFEELAAGPLPSRAEDHGMRSPS